MAEQFLDSAKITAAGEQMGSKAVAQRVGSGPIAAGRAPRAGFAFCAE